MIKVILVVFECIFHYAKKICIFHNPVQKKKVYSTNQIHLLVKHSENYYINTPNDEYFLFSCSNLFFYHYVSPLNYRFKLWTL